MIDHKLARPATRCNSLLPEHDPFHRVGIGDAEEDGVGGRYDFATASASRRQTFRQGIMDREPVAGAQKQQRHLGADPSHAVQPSAAIH